MELSPSFVALASAMVFLATVAQAVTGFGFALVLVPMLSSVADPRSAVIVTSILAMGLSFSLATHAREHISFPVVGLMLLGSLSGIPLGVAILGGFSPSLLKLLIGASVLVMGGLIYFGVVPRIPWKHWPLLVAGFVSGVLSSSTSMSGPPVILCLAGQGHRKDSMRATLLAYFGPLKVITIAGLWLAGLVRQSELLLALASLPAVALGMWLGVAAFRRLPEGLFRAVVALLLTATGLLSIANGMMGR